MLSYQFSNFLFLRSPTYTLEDFAGSTLRQILSESIFRNSLYFASPVLYKQIELLNFDADKLTIGMRETLLKYHNRMCYRTTPFGMFSAFSHTKWGENNEGLIFSDQVKLHLQADYRLSQFIAAGGGSFGIPQTFYSNPSIYTLGTELRYIKTGRNNGAEEQAQGLSAVDNGRSLARLLSLSKNGICRHKLKDLLLEIYPWENPEELLNELLSEELLFSEHSPNVTGENYLKRIGKLLGDRGILALVKMLESLIDPATVKVSLMEALIEPYAVKFEKIRSPFYVNYEKEVCGVVSLEYQEKLRQGLYCLRRLQQDNKKGAINRFKKRFTNRFEEQEVQLMHALDPEAGIGYEFLEEMTESGELLKGIGFEEPGEVKSIAWGPLQEMLISKMSRAGDAGMIVITDDDLEQLPVNNKTLSPGISITFRIFGEKVFIETAGGTTATALIGRFTSFSQNVLAEARALAEAEQAANPDVIFAEIAYSSEEHAANINTREHIRIYEIPVLVHSTLPDERIINLNDLYVSVQRKEVVLRSARLNRRIVPRSGTAYNHVRSELPVFRFLSDLQYQGIEASFSIQPEKLLPGCSFYPRIEYKNCILSEASWVLTSHEIREIHTVQDFTELAEKRRISRYFALSEADRQLVFDIQDLQGLELLVAQMKNSKQQVLLREFFIEEGSNTLLKDGNDKAYIHQLIAYLVNPSKSYFSMHKDRQLVKHAKRYIFPGGTWVYFKIYCSPQNANDILCKIYPLMKKYRADIHKWFFVRYNDPDTHLRVRICGTQELMMKMPSLINVQLKTFTKNSRIYKLQIDTYVREIERYGVGTIDQAEQVFQSSSELVVEYFTTLKSEMQIMQFAMVSVDEILDSFSLSLNTKIALLEKICTNLMNEHGDEKGIRGDLNKKYREHQQLIQKYMPEGRVFLKRLEKSGLTSLCNNLRKFQGGLGNPTSLRMDQYVSDMLHMHMNRIFSNEQRKKELVIYYLVLRYYISLKARAASSLA